MRQLFKRKENIMFSLQSIEIYRNNLIDLTNNCGLTIGTAYYVFKDVLKDLEKEYIKAIEKEQNSQTKSQKEETVGIVEASEEHPNIVTVEAEMEEAE
jgi:GTP1/Obg family GTP-binding protein